MEEQPLCTVVMVIGRKFYPMIREDDGRSHLAALHSSRASTSTGASYERELQWEKVDTPLNLRLLTSKRLKTIIESRLVSEAKEERIAREVIV